MSFAVSLFACNVLSELNSYSMLKLGIRLVGQAISLCTAPALGSCMQAPHTSKRTKLGPSHCQTLDFNEYTERACGGGGEGHL